MLRFACFIYMHKIVYALLENTVLSQAEKLFTQIGEYTIIQDVPMSPFFFHIFSFFSPLSFFLQLCISVSRSPWWSGRS
jgi:hypothetical protein